MSSGAPYQGYNPQPQQGAGYYGGQPQGQVVMVPVQASGGLNIGPFGQNRTIALVGAAIAAIGLVAPWLQIFFLGFSAFSILSLGGTLAAAGGAQGVALVLGAVLSIVGVIIGLPLILLRYSAKGLKVAMLGAVLGFVGALIFLITVLAIGGGPGSGLSVIGFGLWMTLIGSIIQLVGCVRAGAEFAIPPGYTAAAAAAAMAPAKPALEWGGAGTYGRSPSSAPAPSYAAPAQQYPCPQCQRPVAQGAAQCASCGLALTW